MISGWKTKAGAAAMLVLGLIDILNGDVLNGVTKISGALSVYGIGHKIEKK